MLKQLNATKAQKTLHFLSKSNRKIIFHFESSHTVHKVVRELSSRLDLQKKVFISHSYANTTFNEYVVQRILKKQETLNQDVALDIKKFTDYTAYMESWFNQ